MIPLKKVYVLDVYGRRRLGRDYDYRYGGRRRDPDGRPGPGQGAGPQQRRASAAGFVPRPKASPPFILQ